mgnify:CR=1 FL=1
MGSPSSGVVVDVVNARSGRSRSVGSSAERALVPKPSQKSNGLAREGAFLLEALITDFLSTRKGGQGHYQQTRALGLVVEGNLRT